MSLLYKIIIKISVITEETSCICCGPSAGGAGNSLAINIRFIPKRIHFRPASNFTGVNDGDPMHCLSIHSKDHLETITDSNFKLGIACLK